MHGVRVVVHMYKEGASLVVGRTGMNTCPVEMLERYFRMGGLSVGSHDRVFRAVAHTKEGERLSYSRLRELLLEKISQMGMDLQLFGMHSLLAVVPRQQLMLVCLIKRHGRWRFESAKDGYAKDGYQCRGIWRYNWCSHYLCVPMLECYVADRRIDAGTKLMVNREECGNLYGM